MAIVNAVRRMTNRAYGFGAVPGDPCTYASGAPGTIQNWVDEDGRTIGMICTTDPPGTTIVRHWTSPTTASNTPTAPLSPAATPAAAPSGAPSGAPTMGPATAPAVPGASPASPAPVVVPTTSAPQPILVDTGGGGGGGGMPLNLPGGGGAGAPDSSGNWVPWAIGGLALVVLMMPKGRRRSWR